MQNNVTYLSRKLQRSLDNNYNVIDMPAVIEIISTLEKTSVTKELLETTRLGKYINELRRKTSNESLAKRAKELLKKWRDLILPDANGQIRSSSANSGIANATEARADSPKNHHHTKKRPASSTPPDVSRSAASAKKMLLNGQNREYDFSDNSNCSVKDFKKTDVIFINSDSNSSMPESLNPGDHNFEVSNDAADNTDASASSMQPKKRGRKKGSKNHKNLVIAAEESFTNKMAVSRNSKVKTTQELLADIQNRKPSTQDIELRTAQLTESLSRIEHKLNPLKLTRNKSDSRVGFNKVAAGPSSPEALITVASDDEIVDVVGTDPPPPVPVPVMPVRLDEDAGKPAPLTIEHLMGQLPAVDKSCLEADDDDEVPGCACPTPKVTVIAPPLVPQHETTITVQIETPADAKQSSLFAPPSPVTFFSEPVSDNNDADRTSVDVLQSVGDSDCNVGDSDCNVNDSYRNVGDSDCNVNDSDGCVENLLCPAKLFLSDKYCLEAVDDGKVAALHDARLPNVNGNFGAAAPPPLILNVNVDENIVPNFMSERLNNKTPNENFQKYSISISDGEGAAGPRRRATCDSDSDVRTNQTETSDFREWHETLDVISYNDELLTILPYVIID